MPPVFLVYPWPFPDLPTEKFGLILNKSGAIKYPVALCYRCDPGGKFLELGRA